jgi:hypothetical protein
MNYLVWRLREKKVGDDCLLWHTVAHKQYRSNVAVRNVTPSPLDFDRRHAGRIRDRAKTGCIKSRETIRRPVDTGCGMLETPGLSEAGKERAWRRRTQKRQNT